ncbi:unnamed protein product, partial [Schistosoma mattheei]
MLIGVSRSKQAIFLGGRAHTESLTQRSNPQGSGEALGDAVTWWPNSWKITKLNHVAIAVPDLEKAASFYRDILRVEPIKEHGVTTVFVRLDNINIEVDNIYNCLKHLKDKNIRTLSAEPKIGASGAPVLFLHPKDTC